MNVHIAKAGKNNIFRIMSGQQSAQNGITEQGSITNGAANRL
jgi:hypothetical protein